MPAFFLPNKRVEVQLDCDVETSNKFFFRVLTGADVSEIAGLNDTLREIGDGKRAIVAIFDMLQRFLVDWNLTDANGNSVQYEPGKLSSFLTLAEAKEIIEKLMQTMQLSDGDRKK